MKLIALTLLAASLLAAAETPKPADSKAPSGATLDEKFQGSQLEVQYLAAKDAKTQAEKREADAQQRLNAWAQAIQSKYSCQLDQNLNCQPAPAAAAPSPVTAKK